MSAEAKCGEPMVSVGLNVAGDAMHVLIEGDGIQTTRVRMNVTEGRRFRELVNEAVHVMEITEEEIRRNQ